MNFPARDGITAFLVALDDYAGGARAHREAPPRPI